MSKDRDARMGVWAYGRMGEKTSTRPHVHTSLLLFFAFLTCLALPLVSGCRLKKRRAPRLTYVAMGASDTQSAGASRREQGYVYQLLERLKITTGVRWRLVNVGVSGALVTDIAAHQLPRAVRSKPQVVTLWTGGNDVRQKVPLRAFEDNLERIFQTLTTQTNAFIAAASLPEMSRQPFAASMTEAERQAMQARADAINEITTRLAARYGVRLVDLGSGDLMYNPAHLAADGLHLNDLGHTGLAERFWAVLMEVVLQRMPGATGMSTQ